MLPEKSYNPSTTKKPTVLHDFAVVQEDERGGDNGGSESEEAEQIQEVILHYGIIKT